MRPFIQIHIGQITAPFEHALLYHADVARDRDICQLAAILKGVLPDRGDRIRDLDLLYVGALEHASRNNLQAFGERYPFDRGIIERIALELGYAVRYGQLLRSRAVIKRVFLNPFHGGRQSQLA